MSGVKWTYIDEDGVGFVLDGDKWMAGREATFTNQMESPVGFGDTQEEAKADLLEDEKQDAPRRTQ